MLCPTCESISYDELAGEFHVTRGHTGYLHHNSYLSLSTCASTTQCQFCVLTVQAVDFNQDLQQGDQNWRKLPVYLRLVPSNAPLDESDKSNLLVYCEGQSLVMFGLYLERSEREWETGAPDLMIPGAEAINAREVYGDSSGPECVQLANLWLDQCCGKARDGLHPTGLHHIGLGQTIHRPTFIPTRTIDVGPPDGSIEPHLVCHDFTKLNSISWVTLSHCWGGSAPLTTISSNFLQNQSSIPLASMPKTFHDAILITRSLNLRHLWIDSLCIIQDSASDWASEASKMGSVYRFGLLNIAADISTNCHGGMYSTRYKPPVPLAIPLKSARLKIDTKMYVRINRWDDHKPFILGNRSSLSSRGWVLQESVLSPRTLHFTHQQLFWECEHVTLSEGNIVPLSSRKDDGKMGDVVWSTYIWLSSKFILPPSSISASPSSIISAEERKKIHVYWLHLVKNFMIRNLTFPSDVFAALAGTAGIFREALGEEYIAGIFAGNIIPSLLWRVDSVQSVTRSELEGIPSWSWARLVGPVEFAVKVDENMAQPRSVGNLGAKVLESRVSFVNSSTKEGLVGFSGGEIILEASTLNVETSLDQACYLNAHQEPDETPVTLGTLDFSAEEIFLDSPSSMKSSQGKGDQRWMLIHMGIWEWKYDFRPDVPQMRLWRRFLGLLVREVSRGNEQAYERVGIVIARLQFQDVSDDFEFLDRDEAFLTGWKRETMKIV